MTLFALDGMELNTETIVKNVEEVTQNIRKPDEDWKLHQNVECRIILDKLEIKTPKYGTMQFCRTLTNPSLGISSLAETSSVNFQNYPHLLTPPSNSVNLLKKSSELKFSDDNEDGLRATANLLPFPEHVNHFSTIINNLKEEHESSDVEYEEDPLFIPQQHPSDHTYAKDRPFKCDVCGKCLKTLSSLNKHNATHTVVKKMHNCDICGKNYPFRSTLTVHKLAHGGQKPHKCSECGKCFTMPGILAQHKLTHTGEKRHMCYFCGKYFPQPGSLTKHKLTHTTGKKPYMCDSCGKCFTSKYNLTSHKFLHAGEKPHKCDLCENYFGRTLDLARHKFSHTREK